jgi:hypothetical protein
MRANGERVTGMIDLQRIARQRLQTEPYRWAVIDGLFSAPDGAALAASYPCDHFKRPIWAVSPIVGNSAVIVRSDTSWHAVSPVVKNCQVAPAHVVVSPSPMRRSSDPA